MSQLGKPGMEPKKKAKVKPGVPNSIICWWRYNQGRDKQLLGVSAYWRERVNPSGDSTIPGAGISFAHEPV